MSAFFLFFPDLTFTSAFLLVDLYSKIAPGAIHDSEERCDAPKCHPKTRRMVQEHIITWIRDGDSEPKCILWLSGPAGAGKTAIAGSVAEVCESEGILAATFFFSSFLGSEERRYKRSPIPTLVYQLIQLDGFEGYADLVLATIRRNPAIFDKQLKSQLDALIIKPLRSLRRLGVPTPSACAIIIDGVDEVEAPNTRQLEQSKARIANEVDQVDVLSSLQQAATDPSFPFRIVVVSRPERVIRDFFATSDPRPKELFLDANYDPDSDITLFLKAKFAEIRRRFELPPSWPTEETIVKLAEMASGQFVYAATVVRFLQEGKYPDPQTLLCTVMDWQSEDTVIRHDALGPLNALYSRILMSSPDPLLAAVWIISIWLLEGMPALFFRQLFQDFEGQAAYVMENLTSILHMPAYDDPNMPYSIYHKSLVDFLITTRREEGSGANIVQESANLSPIRCVGVLKSAEMIPFYAYLADY